MVILGAVGSPNLAEIGLYKLSVYYTQLEWVDSIALIGQFQSG
jgi:hypothetical protein